ncbi:hypothetical protein [Cohnella sp. AR92]|uniref:hypothetical protein n=1 Tax=Cohnella sp. AR92 TaxID=648716 RepID=UPI00192E02D1|nr:hypothetical protein [Cohnella sp. AR92]
MDQAKFCSGCGTAVQGYPQQAVQPAQTAPTMPTETPDYSPEHQEHSNIYDLLGYKVEVPKETEFYVHIRNEFEELAEEARQRMAGNFDTRYRSLDDLIRYGDDDSESYYNSALEHAVDMLRSLGIYNVNISRFSDIALEHSGYWESSFSDIREKFQELTDYKEAKKDYRASRKAGRGRLVGGGFGVGGALKGMAMAGSANMATGLLHSFTNALGNAATSAEVSSMKGKIFKNPETRRSLSISVYLDIFSVHMAVVECLNDRELSLVAESYDADQYEESAIMYNNIRNGNVRKQDLTRLIAEILQKYPFDMDYFDLALEHVAEENRNDLIEYARLFKMPIDERLREIHEANASRERLAQLFGGSAGELEDKLQSNRLFHSIKSELPANPIEAVRKAFYSVQNDNLKTKAFLVSADAIDKLANKLQNVRASYAPFQGETPFLLYDNTAFGSAKNGLFITDQRIYVSNMMEKAWSMSLQDIERIDLSGSSILINGKSADIVQVSGRDRENFHEFIQLLIFVQKYSGSLSPGAAAGRGTASQEVRSARSEASAAKLAPAPVAGAEKGIDYVRNTILSLNNQSLRNYLFIENENEKAAKKFRNAREAYAFLKPDETPILLFDNTAFGSAKDGFLVTDRRIYIHNMLQKPAQIDIADIVSLGLKGSDLLFNQQVAYINLIDSSSRSAFRDLMEKFIERLR